MKNNFVNFLLLLMICVNIVLCQKYNGGCYNGGTPYKLGCICASGFEGYMCKLKTCVHGSHHAMNNYYKCTCNRGWSGEICDVVKCIHGAYVNDTQCACNTGYEGSSCEKILCKHGKRGRTSYKTDKCDCNENWTGTFCEVFNCDNGQVNADGQSCTCNSDSYGVLCDKLRKKEKSTNLSTFFIVIGIIITITFTCCCCAYTCSSDDDESLSDSPVVVISNTRSMASTHHAQTYTPMQIEAQTEPRRPELKETPPPTYEEAIEFNRYKQI